MTSLSPFQSSLPRGERHNNNAIHTLKGRFQSSLPRGERRCFVRCKTFLTDISILAPTRGATLKVVEPTAEVIFQSSLPRGERHSFPKYFSFDFEFQSSLPRGERQFIIFPPIGFIKISILAPTRGATHGTAIRQFYLRDFNPRSHEGSDKLKHQLL